MVLVVIYQNFVTLHHAFWWHMGFLNFWALDFRHTKEQFFQLRPAFSGHLEAGMANVSCSKRNQAGRLLERTSQGNVLRSSWHWNSLVFWWTLYLRIVLPGIWFFNNLGSIESCHSWWSVEHIEAKFYWAGNSQPKTTDLSGSIYS